METDREIQEVDQSFSTLLAVQSTDDVIIPFDVLANYLATTDDFEGFDRNLWERLIRENMEGMQNKP